MCITPGLLDRAGNLWMGVGSDFRSMGVGL